MYRVLLRLSERRLEWAKRLSRTGQCPTGLDTRLTTKSDIMRREDIGEEPSSSSESPFTDQLIQGITVF